MLIYPKAWVPEYQVRLSGFPYIQSLFPGLFVL